MPTEGKFYWQVGGNLEEWPDQGVRPHQDDASSYRSVSIAKMFCRQRGKNRPEGPILLFLFWTVHGPFSLFLLEEKEKMGGAKDQPSSWLKSLPARQGETKPPP